jgi:hypothetical protein
MDPDPNPGGLDVDPDSDPDQQQCKHHDETYTVTAEMKQDKKWRKWTRQS